MDSTRAWKDPEYRRELGKDAENNPAGLVDLDSPAGLVDLNDDAAVGVAGGTSAWACATVTATIALTATICSPSGTMCGSCQMGTNGCCH